MQFDVNIRLFEYSEADLEGRAGRAGRAPPSLKFAKHMLYNVN